MPELKTIRATTVEILGNEFRLTGDDESVLKQLAGYVDNQMMVCREKCTVYSSGQLGVLTCLNIADQLFKLKKEYKDSISETIDSISHSIRKIDKILEVLEKDKPTDTATAQTELFARV